MRWLVDGMNVIGSRPDGWWRDRPAARRRLVGELAAFAERENGEVTVVFDGRGDPGEVEAGRAQGVTVDFAPGGPDAADRVIAAMVEPQVATEGSRDVATDDGSATIVTSDAELARRVRAFGADVIGAASFLRRISPVAPPGRPGPSPGEARQVGRWDGHPSPDM